MSGTTINISFEEVTAIASKISELNTGLTERLSEIKTAVINLESTWESQASETIRTKMDGMQGRFDEYKEIVDSYADFLNKTVAAYEDAENQLQTYASSFN